MARLAVFAALLFFAGVAAAQSARLSAAEARAELFGVQLMGIVEGEGEPWSECIDPAGRTLYRIGGGEDVGRLTISPEGHACFSYVSSGYGERACWVVRRAGRNYRFESAQGADLVFLTQTVTRGVRRCEGGDVPVA